MIFSWVCFPTCSGRSLGLVSGSDIIYYSALIGGGQTYLVIRAIFVKVESEPRSILFLGCTRQWSKAALLSPLQDSHLSKDVPPTVFSEVVKTAK